MMASPLFTALFLSVAGKAAGSQLVKNVTPFAENIFGVWKLKPDVPTKAILGPIAYYYLDYGEGGLNAGFSALRDPDTNDVWFTLLEGQMWHVTGNETQYCFGPSSSKQLFEQSPFSVEAITETSVSFCWRRGLYGMPTHTKGCFGCDCAKILLTLTDLDTLHFQFWMSPPVPHADLTFVRTAPAPTFQQAIESTMDTPYKQCQIVDHYGPNVPGEPDLRTTTAPPTSKFAGGGCETILAEKARQMRNDDLVSQGSGSASGQCYQLNGVNFNLDNKARLLQPQFVMNVSDVKVLFTTPAPPCNPCDVSYSVSAKIDPNEYIAVGFKGRSWEKDFPFPPVKPRPCYFGMCLDSNDNFTSDRIALGYTANGGCVREMVAKNYVGSPEDVDYKILKGTSVERAGDRTILRFTISQFWQYPEPNSTGSPDGPWRIMWAIGSVTGANGCAATIAYHSNHRGVAPLNWLTSGSTPCNWTDSGIVSTLVV